MLFLGGYQYWKDGYIDDIDDTRKRSMHLFIISVCELLDGWELLYVDLMWRTKFNWELGMESFGMERLKDLRKQRCIQNL